MASLPFGEGDDVRVTGLDGEDGSARVVEVLDTTAGEHVLFADSGTPVTVADYWGRTIDGSEAVVRIRYVDADGETISKPYTLLF